MQTLSSISNSQKSTIMCNVGKIDRIVRGILGAGLIGLSAYLKWHWLPLAAGIILLATAAFSFCPLYKLFGISTCK